MLVHRLRNIVAPFDVRDAHVGLDLGTVLARAQITVVITDLGPVARAIDLVATRIPVGNEDVVCIPAFEIEWALDVLFTGQGLPRQDRAPGLFIRVVARYIEDRAADGCTNVSRLMVPDCRDRCLCITGLDLALQRTAILAEGHRSEDRVLRIIAAIDGIDATNQLDDRFLRNVLLASSTGISRRRVQHRGRTVQNDQDVRRQTRGAREKIDVRKARHCGRRIGEEAHRRHQRDDE